MTVSIILASTTLFLAAPTAFTIEGIAPPEAVESDTLHRLAVSGDVDGDGRADAAMLAVRCAQGQHIKSAVLTAREAGSGLATGRRQHGPIRWFPPTAELAKVKASWNLKENVKRTAGPSSSSSEGSEVTLDGADGLCAAASGRATKTRSNIQNN